MTCYFRAIFMFIEAPPPELVSFSRKAHQHFSDLSLYCGAEGAGIFGFTPLFPRRDYESEARCIICEEWGRKARHDAPFILAGSLLSLFIFF